MKIKVFISKHENYYHAQADGMAAMWSRAATIEAVKLQFLMEYQDFPVEWEFETLAVPSKP